nr:Pycsar system effector family protein [Planomonospora venezuelensis]
MFEWWSRRLAKRAADERQAAEQDACDYGSRLLDEAREELHKADGKAQVLLGIVGVGLGAITGGLLAGGWSPFELENAVEWLWWAGAGSAVAAVATLAGAVYPRFDSRDRHLPDGVTYFADVLRYTSVKAVSDALLRSSTLDLERIAHQLHQVSKIVNRKYRLIRWGFWLMLGAITATVGSVLVNLALS